MNMKKIFLVIIFLLPIVSFADFDHDDELTYWAGYEQQFGALQKEFITYGGGTAGLSIYGISVGASVFGNYAYNATSPATGEPYRLVVIYGGVVLGYKSPEFSIVRFRFNTTLGYGTIENDITKTGHFVVSPTLYTDIKLVGDLILSIGVTYRYFHDYTGILDINNAENSFAGTIALSWIGD